MRNLNIDNLTRHPEEVNAPWGDLLYTDDCMISSYAAHGALSTLAASWNDDYGQDRAFVVETTRFTIQLLQAWLDAFEAVVLTQDRIDTVKADLRADLVTDDLMYETVAKAREALVAVEKKRAAWGQYSALEALVNAAYAPTTPTNTTAPNTTTEQE